MAGAKGGRLEARLTVPGWTVSATDTVVGTRNVTVPAGDYYPTELCAALETALATGGAAWSVTPNNDEGLPSSSSSTGRVEIVEESGAFSLSFTGAGADLGTALGFTSSIVAETTPQTGTAHMKGLWLPGVQHKSSMYGDGASGSIQSIYRSMTSATGAMSVVHSAAQRHRVHKDIRWDGVPSQRAIEAHEVVSGESFESFYLDCTTGRLSYIGVNPYIRLTWDADVDATYAAGRLQWSGGFDLEQFVQGCTGRFKVALPPLIVPAVAA